MGRGRSCASNQHAPGDRSSVWAAWPRRPSQQALWRDARPGRRHPTGPASAAAEASDYKAAPAPIADSDIKETVEADIVVIGGSVLIRGRCHAAEASKKVVAAESGDGASRIGSGGLNCRRSENADFDPGSGHRMDPPG
ncbi:MAG: hypothetical protein ACLSVD_12650 [Eggerthellaceae bacterium]